MTHTSHITEANYQMMKWNIFKGTDFVCSDFLQRVNSKLDCFTYESIELRERIFEFLCDKNFDKVYESMERFKFQPK